MLWISFCIVLMGVSLFCFLFGYKRGILVQASEQRRSMAEQIRYQNFTKYKNVVKQNNISLENYFINRNQKIIAVYGLGQYYYELLQNFDRSKFDKVYLGDRSKMDKQESLS